jgi:hypothetical protein
MMCAVGRVLVIHISSLEIAGRLNQSEAGRSAPYMLGQAQGCFFEVLEPGQDMLKGSLT